jgi:hypothetical protein
MDTSVSPEGTASVTVTFAVVAPAEAPFFTVTVYVAPCCAALKLPVWVLEIVSAGAATVTDAVDVTVDDTPPPDRLIGILTGVPFTAVTFPVTVMGGKLDPAASASLRVQVIEDRVHVQPVPAMAVTVKPVGGSTTVTVPFVAALPVFETVML